MSLQAVGAVASYPKMSAQERGLAYELANCANAETGKCYPSITYLAERLDCTALTIRRTLRKLEERGVIDVIPHFIDGRQSTNSYIFRDYLNGTKVISRGITSDSPEGIVSDSPEGITSDTRNQEEESGRGNRGKNGSRFVPPTMEEVTAKVKEKGYKHVDAEEFVLFYESKGWMIGKNKMKSWEAALGRWEAQNRKGMQNRPRSGYDGMTVGGGI